MITKYKIKAAESCLGSTALILYGDNYLFDKAFFT